MTYRLHRRQMVGGTLPEVFAFFKDPHNLEAITPPWLGFRIDGGADGQMRVGTRIRYRLRLHGIRIGWESRISEYEENCLFADEQLSGPYRRWYHRHLFYPMPGGVVIEDIVDYQLPLGTLGRLMHALLVAPRLRAIFDYRALTIRERFPLPRSEPNLAVIGAER